MKENLTPRLLQAIAEYQTGNVMAYSVICEETDKTIYTYVRYLLGDLNGTDVRTAQIVEQVYRELYACYAQMEGENPSMPYFAPMDIYKSAFKIANRDCRVCFGRCMVAADRSSYGEGSTEGRKLEALCGECVIPDTVRESEEQRQLVRTVILSGLSQEERSLLVAHYCAGEDSATLAENYEMTKERVELLLSRGRAAVKEAMSAAIAGQKPVPTMEQLGPWMQYFMQDDIYKCQVPVYVRSRIAKVCSMAVSMTGGVVAANGSTAVGAQSMVSGLAAAGGNSAGVAEAMASGLAGGNAGAGLASGASMGISAGTDMGAVGSGSAGIAMASAGGRIAEKGITGFFASVVGKVAIGIAAAAVVIGGGVAAYQAVTTGDHGKSEIVATATDAAVSTEESQVVLQTTTAAETTEVTTDEAVTDAVTEAQAVETQTAMGKKDDAKIYREKYQEALYALLHDYLLPDGESIYDEDILSEVISDCRFGIADIDEDGNEELIIQRDGPFTYNMSVRVYQYRQDTDDYLLELLGSTGAHFYRDGWVDIPTIHNQSSSHYWPHIVYKYDQATDTYVEETVIRGWDKSVVSVDGSGSPFPDDIDADGNGTVYNVYDQWVDDAACNQFVADTYGQKEEITVVLIDLTEGNIAAITN